MSDWREGLKRALVETIIDQGSLVRERPNEYGWRDYKHTKRAEAAEKARHMAGIDWARTQMPNVSAWLEFDGTFADPPHQTKRGVDAVIVLNDGHQFTYRLEIDLGRLIQKVVTA